jgi:hypothetical protein
VSLPLLALSATSLDFDHTGSSLLYRCKELNMNKNQHIKREFSKSLATVTLILFATLSFADIYTDFPSELEGYDPNVQIHISSKTDANTLRQKVIDYIWDSNGILPDTLPSTRDVYTGQGAFLPDLEGVEPALLARVEQLTVKVDFGFEHITYQLHPVKLAQPERLLIIHQGHQGGLVDGISEMANKALDHGLIVLLSQMPGSSWNRDNTFEIQGTRSVPTTITIDGIDQTYCSTFHKNMFSKLEPDIGGKIFRFFLEPIVVGINKFIHSFPDHNDVSMIGLSGGGWTTALMAAIDTRIDLSIPVAGSYPLYLRGLYQSEGDAEQNWPALYEETASWLDLYILGAYGPGRRQIQLNSQFDSCCFYGLGYLSYAPAVMDTVSSLGKGHWEYVLDTTHRSHQISTWAREEVVGPALGIPAATSEEGTPESEASVTKGEQGVPAVPTR